MDAERRLVTDDFVRHWPGREIHGPGRLAEVIARTRDMFTSVRFVVEAGPLVDGDPLTGRWAGLRFAEYRAASSQGV